jgi:L-threonylcarbamoyladenylate synthase
VTTEIGKDIAKARELLERGLLVAIPTETVYGLAANALDADAVVQIFEAKNRPYFDPLIVHGHSKEQLARYVTAFPPWAAELADKFWPGPLTLVLPKREEIPGIVTSGLDRIAVRVPAHPMTLDLLGQLDFPLAAPSANPFGYVSPTTPQHVKDQLDGLIPYILDGGECEVGVESTIVTETDGKLQVLRLGGISVEEIESHVGSVELSVDAEESPLSPGSLKSHYATGTPLIFGPIDLERYDPNTVGVLSFKSRYAALPVEHQITLSPEGNLHEAAKYLFAALRHLDSLNLEVILAEEFPETGLGRAINDRLRRASV